MARYQGPTGWPERLAGLTMGVPVGLSWGVSGLAWGAALGFGVWTGFMFGTVGGFCIGGLFCVAAVSVRPYGSATPHSSRTSAGGLAMAMLIAPSIVATIIGAIVWLIRGA